MKLSGIFPGDAEISHPDSAPRRLRAMLGNGWDAVGVGEVEDDGDRGSRRAPRLVQHICYSAVKMAASEGARSGRTSAKRF